MQPIHGRQIRLCIVGMVRVNTVHAVWIRGSAVAQHGIALHDGIPVVLETVVMILRLHFDGRFD